MISTIIIARWYGAEMMGIVALLNSFLILATIFTVLGTNTSILRLVPEHLAKYSPSSAFKVYRKTQYFVVGVSLITGSILFFGSGFIAETIFSKPHLQFYFALGALSIILKSLMDLNTQAVRGVRLIRTFAFMQLLPHLSMLVILVIITIFFFHQDNPIYALFLSFAITALAGVWIMDKVFKKKIAPKDPLQPMPIKDILSISLPMLLTSTMAFVIGRTGVIILGMFRPEAEVGYFAVAVKLSSLTLFAISSVDSLAAPKFSELFHLGKMEDIFHIAKKSAKLIFWTTTPLLLILLIFGRAIISLLFGHNFMVAYWAMVLLVIGRFVSSISGSTAMFMNMTGHHKLFGNIMLIAAISNIILNLIFIPQMGFYGAALAAMICISFYNITPLIYIKLKYGKTVGYLPVFG